MILIKKKQVLQDLATTLFLMKELVVHPDASAYIPALREQATEILAAAQPYTGLLGEKQLREFFKAKPKKFTIACDTDVVRGDTIRFVEQVIDNRRNPSRILGKRGITADVLSVYTRTDNPILLLRVIASGGVWDLQPGTDIRRTLRSISQFDLCRAPWEDEGKRTAVRNEALAAATVPASGAPPTMLGRYDQLRDK